MIYIYDDNDDDDDYDEVWDFGSHDTYPSLNSASPWI
jgi:hypothetical protein